MSAARDDSYFGRDVPVLDEHADQLPDAYVTVYPKDGPVTLGGAYSRREHAEQSARINGNGARVVRYVPICESSLTHGHMSECFEAVTRSCVLRDGHRGLHRAEDGSSWGSER